MTLICYMVGHRIPMANPTIQFLVKLCCITTDNTSVGGFFPIEKT